jgi:hypothetical protein
MFWVKSVTESMKTERPHESDVTQSRFGTVLFIFNLVGIQFGTQSTSSVHSAYNATTVVCFYITCVSCFMDPFVNKDNLEELMKSIRIGFSMPLIVLVHMFIRYNSSLNKMPYN